MSRPYRPDVGHQGALPSPVSCQTGWLGSPPPLRLPQSLAFPCDPGRMPSPPVHPGQAQADPPDARFCLIVMSRAAHASIRGSKVLAHQTWVKLLSFAAPEPRASEQPLARALPEQAGTRQTSDLRLARPPPFHSPASPPGSPTPACNTQSLPPLQMQADFGHSVLPSQCGCLLPLPPGEACPSRAHVGFHVLYSCRQGCQVTHSPTSALPGSSRRPSLGSVSVFQLHSGGLEINVL